MSKTTKEWKSIYQVIKEHSPYPPKNVGESLCFNSVENCPMCQDEGINPKEVKRCPHIDYNEVTHKRLVVKCDQYNLMKDERDLNMIEEVDEDEYFENKQDCHIENSPREEIKKEEADEHKSITPEDDGNSIVSQDHKSEENKESLEDTVKSVTELSSK
jgi:hypothetical protein